MAKFIRDVEAIFDRNESFPIEKELAELVEEPLLEACIKLVRKNVRTLCTSANKNDIGRNAVLVISASELSEENRAVAIELGARETPDGHWGHSFTFPYPLNEESTVAEVAEHYNGVADAFYLQEYTWVSKMSFASYLEANYGVRLSRKKIDWINSQKSVEHKPTGEIINWPDVLAEEIASDAKPYFSYYDEKTRCFYRSQEDYEKEQASREACDSQK